MYVHKYNYLMTGTAVEKHTPIEHPVHPLISARWSTRAFNSHKVSEATIRQLLEAMRWAPSAMNEQPWEVFVATEGSATYLKLAHALNPSNKIWAAKAPLLMLVNARTTFAANGAPNGSALYDLGLAVGNLSLEATHHGLSMHQMGGFDKSSVKESLGLNGDRFPVVIIAIGHGGAPETLPDALKERELAPRRRKFIDEFSVIDLG